MPTKGSGSRAITAYTKIYRRLFADKYFETRCLFVQLFAEHIVEVSRFFEADLRSVVVLAIVGQMEIEARIRSHVDRPGSTPRDAVTGTPLRTNTSTIAEISGIPRETVRRKIDTLARRGWIERDPKGLWHFKMDGTDSAPARGELLEIDRRQTERVCRFLGRMHALAIEAQARGAIDPPTNPSTAGLAGEAD